MYRKVSSKDIDVSKWDRAISKSKLWRNPIYGYYWYLTASIENKWFGLIKNDYELVAPIPIKYHPRYLKLSSRPSFTQQLGWFGEVVSKEDYSYLIQYLDSTFTTLFYPCPLLNGEEYKSKGFRTRCNLKLSLNESYDFNFNKYSKSLKKRIRNHRQNIRIENSFGVDDHIDFYKKNLKSKFVLSKSDQLALKNIIVKAIELEKGEILQIFDIESGDLLTSSFFLIADNFLTNLSGASSQKGKLKFSMHCCLDHYIKKFSSTNFVLDFEGSDISGVQAFFKSFGAIHDDYLNIEKRDSFIDNIILKV